MAERVRTRPSLRPGLQSDGTAVAREHLAPWLGLGLSLVPFVAAAVALVVRVGNDYYPSSDWAVTEMHVRDIGHHQVLTGLYSTADWSHPGPLLFYLLAPFYWLTGGASIGLLLGALAINAAALVGIALIAQRCGGTPLLLCALVGAGLLIRTLGAGFISDPWVISIATLPFALLLLLVWSMTRGDAWALPLGALVATFLAQTHVGFVVLALPLFAFGAAWLVVVARRDALRAGWLSAGILIVLWLPPLLDVLINEPSNLGKVVRHFRYSDDPTHSLIESPWISRRL